MNWNPPPAFDLRLGKICLDASARAYVETPSAPNGVQSDLAHVLIVGYGRADVAVAEAGHAPGELIIVAFRGTASIRDWLTDLDARMVSPGGGVEVHKGFLAALTSVIDPIMARLGPARDELLAVPRIVLTGHSLGGALAMLCAKALFSAGFPIDAVYTFGQPRVGNEMFAGNYDLVLGQRTWRFVNEADIVPRAPGLLAGYRHAGNEVFLNAECGIDFNPPWWRKARSDAAGMLKAWWRARKFGAVPCDVAGLRAMADPLEDHLIASYGRRLGVETTETRRNTEGEMA